MKTSLWLWLIAVLVTLFLARHQRTTGPTYPISGAATLGASQFKYVLERTHAGAGGHRVAIEPGAADAEGTLEYHVLRSADGWTSVPMRREGAALVGELPHQPPAGKVAYRVRLESGGQTLELPEKQDAAVLRFRGEVPAWVLLPHIVFMFGAMLLSMRAGLEVVNAKPALRALTDWTVGLLFAGGFLLGPLVSWYAFQEPWGGFPLGNDPTDNKTLVAFVGWLVAAVAVRRLKLQKPWVVLAALLMLVVYIIPHSISMPG